MITNSTICKMVLTPINQHCHSERHFPMLQGANIVTETTINDGCLIHDPILTGCKLWKVNLLSDNNIPLDSILVHSIIYKEEGQEKESVDQCCCLCVNSIGSAINWANQAIRVSPLECVLSNCKQLINTLCACKNASFESKSKLDASVLYCLDIFYKSRHDILHNIVFQALVDGKEHVTKSFQDYGVNSERTPDYLGEVGSQLYLIETTVVNNYESAIMNKGNWRVMATLKYYREYQELINKGLEPKYLNLIFCLAHDSVMDVVAEINEQLQFTLAEQVVNTISKVFREFKELNYLIGRDLHLESSILFSNLEVETVAQTNMETVHFINKSYDSSYIRPPIPRDQMNQFILLWGSLVKKVQNLCRSITVRNSKYSLVLDITSRPSLNLKRDVLGLNIECILDALKNFDMTTLLPVLKVTKNGESITREHDTYAMFYKIARVNPDLRPITLYQPIHENYSTVITDQMVPVHYSAISANYNASKLITDLYDPNYEGKVLNFLENTLPKIVLGSKCNLLVSYSINDIDPELVTTRLYNKWVNNFQEVNLFIHNRQPFTYPVVDCLKDDYVGLGVKNYGLYNTVLRKVDTNLTKIILEGLIADRVSLSVKRDYSSVIPLKHKLLELRLKLSKEEYRNSNEVKRVGEELRLKVTSINRKHKDMTRLKIKRMKGLFKEETEHIRWPGNTDRRYRGVPVSDYNKGQHAVYQGYFNDVMDYISEIAESLCMNFIDLQPINEYSEYDRMENCMTDLRKDVLTELSSMRLAHILLFIQHFSKALFNLSCQNIRGDTIVCDNLGYKNVLIIVKGGSNSNDKNNDSKFYRLLYPISPKLIQWYSGYDHDYKFINYEGREFVLTPWSKIKTQMLLDGMCIGMRYLNYLHSNVQNSTVAEALPRLLPQVMLGLHNRRSTEEKLSNLRYILFNSTGIYADLFSTLYSLISIPRDTMERYIIGCIVYNFQEYFQSIRDNQGRINSISLLNPNCRLKEPMELSNSIYSTFLMTKAAYTPAIERSTNMCNILETHDLYMSEVGATDPDEQFIKCNVSLNDNSDDEWVRKLFENDFKVDFNFVASLSHFTNDYLDNVTTEGELLTDWNAILDSSWSTIAKSTGMRGEGPKGPFFGSKGYDVVYHRLLKEIDTAEVMHHLNDDTVAGKKALSLMHQSFRDAIPSSITQDRTFHTAEKAQWRGSREIYIMDIDTKICQQPIEQFSAILCKLIENEIISIPSDQRAMFIHTKVFKSHLNASDIDVSYFTADCKKWAPRSIFLKLMVFIAGIKIIPIGFKMLLWNLFLTFFEKKVYFNKQESDILKNNSKRQHLVKYLEFDESKKAYYIKMPYSWMMGIFNYLSSMMHAASQLYISHLIFKASEKWNKGPVYIYMLAHSDDSGGSISYRDGLGLKFGLAAYEILQKSLNHLLSAKKSVVSKSYFEILSVIYYNSQLLPLTPKFTGGVRFIPTGGGYVADMKNVYSKINELLANGVSITNCFIAAKMYTYHVWRKYFNSPPSKQDYDRPIEHLGMPRVNPVLVLLGSEYSSFYHILCNDDLSDRCQNLINSFIQFSLLLSKECDMRILDVKVNTEISYNLELRRKMECNKVFATIDSDLQWILNNCKFHNTGIDTLQYINKLQTDINFYKALRVNTELKRYLQFEKSMMEDKFVINDVKLPPQSALDVCRLAYADSSDLQTVASLFEYAGQVMSENEKQSRTRVFEVEIKETKRRLAFLKKLEVMLSAADYTPRHMDVSNRTFKPISLSIQRFVPVFNINFNCAALAAVIKKPSILPLLSNTVNLIQAKFQLDNWLKLHNIDIDDYTIDQLCYLIETLSKRKERDRYLYASIPTNKRRYNNIADFTYYIAYNFIDGKAVPSVLNKNSNYVFLDEPVDESLYELYYFLMSLSFVIHHEPAIKYEINVREKELLSLSDYLRGIDTVNISPLAILPYKYLCNQLHLPCTEELTDRCMYHFFKKSQFRKERWVGEGILTFVYGADIMDLYLSNQAIIEVHANFDGVLAVEFTEYIKLILQRSAIEIDKSKMQVAKPNKLYFGVNSMDMYCINDVKWLTRGYPVRYTRLTHPDKTYSTLDFLHLGAFLVKKEVLSKGIIEIKLNTLMTASSCVLRQLQKVVLTDSAKCIINSKGYNSQTDFIMEMLGHSHTNNLRITFDELTANYTSSFLYKVFYHTERVHNISCTTLTPNTGEIGNRHGFLMALIRYNEIQPTIKVLDVITEEFLRIKAEFPSNVGPVLSERLRAHAKDILQSDLSIKVKEDLIKLLPMDDFKAGIIKLLQYWGIHTLLNSIVGFEDIPNVANFRIFYYWQEATAYNIHLVIYPCWKLIVELCMCGDEYPKFIEVHPLYENLTANMVLNQLVFSMIQNTFMSGSIGNPFSLNILHDCLEYVFRKEGIFTLFKKEIAETPYLNRLPADLEYLDRWHGVINVMFNMLRNEYSINCNTQDCSREPAIQNFLEAKLTQQEKLISTGKIKPKKAVKLPKRTIDLHHSVRTLTDKIGYTFKPRMERTLTFPVIQQLEYLKLSSIYGSMPVCCRTKELKLVGSSVLPNAIMHKRFKIPDDKKDDYYDFCMDVLDDPDHTSSDYYGFMNDFWVASSYDTLVLDNETYSIFDIFWACGLRVEEGCVINTIRGATDRGVLISDKIFKKWVDVMPNSGIRLISNSIFNTNENKILIAHYFSNDYVTISYLNKLLPGKNLDNRVEPANYNNSIDTEGEVCDAEEMIAELYNKALEAYKNRGCGGSSNDSDEAATQKDIIDGGEEAFGFNWEPNEDDIALNVETINMEFDNSDGLGELAINIDNGNPDNVTSNMGAVNMEYDASSSQQESVIITDNSNLNNATLLHWADYPVDEDKQEDDLSDTDTDNNSKSNGSGNDPPPCDELLTAAGERLSEVLSEWQDLENKLVTLGIAEDTLNKIRLAYKSAKGTETQEGKMQDEAMVEALSKEIAKQLLGGGLGQSMDTESMSKVLQVPGFYRQTTNKYPGGQTVIKDKRLLAELTSLNIDLPDKVASGCFYITQDTYDDIENLIDMQVAYIRDFQSAERKEAKFWIMLIISLLNDAIITSDGLDDDLLKSISLRVSKLVNKKGRLSRQEPPTDMTECLDKPPQTNIQYTVVLN